MHTLLTDRKIYRRRRMHFVVDENGDLEWSGTTIAEALRYLEAQGEVRFRLEGSEPDENFIIQLISGVVLARHDG